MLLKIVPEQTSDQARDLFYIEGDYFVKLYGEQKEGFTYHNPFGEFSGPGTVLVVTKGKEVTLIHVQSAMLWVLGPDGKTIESIYLK